MKARLACVLTAMGTALISLGCAGGAIEEPTGPLSSTDLLGVCPTPDRCGIMDMFGQWVFEPEYEWVPWRPEGSFAMKRLDQKVTLVDRSARHMRVIETPHEGVPTRVSEDRFAVRIRGYQSPWMLLDMQGQRLGDLKLRWLQRSPQGSAGPLGAAVTRDAFTVSSGLIAGCTAEKQTINDCGFITRDGQWWRTCPDPASFSEGLGTCGDSLLRADGSVLLEKVQLATGFSEGHAIARVSLPGESEDEMREAWVILDTRGRVVVEFAQELGNKALAFREGRAVVRPGPQGKAFVDTAGAFYPAPAGTGVLDQLYEGLALYAPRKEGPWGYVDADGNVAIPPFASRPEHHEDLANMRFSEGLAAARQPLAEGGRWGYIDREGTWVLGPVFERAEPFVRGIARVRIDDRWTWVHTDGREILPVQ